MKNKIFLIVIILIGLSSTIYSQTLFRNSIFLHRSVGNHIYSHPNASTSVPTEITSYNSTNSYTGDEVVRMDIREFPIAYNGGTVSNQWYQWHLIFDKVNTDDDLYGDYLDTETYSLIILKTCFYSSEYAGVGQASDTTNHPEYLTIYNDKWHWRSIIKIMESYPNKFFVIWTNAPLLDAVSTQQNADYADWFCTWAKDTLAAGLDATYGAFPENVYVFDYFHKLADVNHYLPVAYADGPSDSHPNADASELIAPLFVQETFDAAIAYEEGSVPVELTLFSGYYEDGAVNLQWVTATEINNFGFEVERRDDYSSYQTIGFVNGNGTSTNRVTYNFVDKNLSANRYYYRLKQIDLDGTFEYSNELEIDFNTLTTYSLEQNYPNPFNPSTEINFTLAKSGNVTLKVYDSLGSEMETLVDGFMNSGKHSVKFNAKGLTTGIYYYRIKAENFTSTRKMLLIK
jgi:hypothetical protein